MIGLRELASLLASAVVLFGSVVVPAGDQGTVAVESVGEDVTRAVADKPVAIAVDEAEVYDLVTSRGAPAPPASLEGGFEEVRFLTGVSSSTTISLGEQRMPVAAGSAVAIEGFSGSLDAAPGEAGVLLSLTGTAKSVEIQDPGAPRIQTASEDADSIPVANVSLDGSEITGPIQQSGSFAELSFTVEPSPADSPPLLEIDGEVFPVEQTVRVRASDYAGVVAVVEADHDHVALRLDGFGNLSILGDEFQRQFGHEENVSTDNPNEDPEAAFTFRPSQPQAQETVHFRSQSSDDTEIRAWDWEFGDGDGSQAQHPEHIFPSSGTFEVSLTVTDVLGRTNTTTTQVDVVNSRPIVSLAWDPEDPIEGSSVELTAEATDRDGEIVAYDWTVPNRTSPSGRTVNHTFAEQGIYTVQVNVSDQEGANASAEANVIVQNAPPQPSFTVDPVEPMARETVFLESTSSDYGDGQVTEHLWEIESVGTEDGDVAKVTFPRDGPHEVRLQVRDDDGDTANVTRTIDVQNAPPEAEIRITPQPINPHTEIEFQADVTDDDPIEQANWTFSDGGESNGLQTTRSFPSGGTYNVSLAMKDADGAWGTQQTSFYVNKAPDASLGPLHLEAADEMAVETSELFTVSSRIDDPDSEDVSLSWSVDGNRPIDANYCTHAPDGNESRMQCGWPDDGRHLIRIHARDEEGATSTARIEVLVLNRAPTMNPSVFPDVVNTDERVTMEANADDPDGSVDEILWAVDGSDAGIGPTLDHTFTEAGNHTVQIMATDDDEAVSSTTFHVDVNAKPEATFSFTPDDPVAGKNVSFTADARDPDGDDGALAYEWDFDDGTTANGTDVTHAFQTSGTHRVELKVTDEQGASILVEEPVDVDKPALGASLSMTPSQPGAGEEVTFSVDVQDGREIESIEWSFGDGTRTTTGQGVSSVSHVYDDPETHPLRLEVHADYDQSQEINAPVRITGAESYELVFEPRLPDGECLNLTSDKVDVRATNLATDTTIGLKSGDVTWNTGTCTVRYTFSAGAWSIGDQLDTSVQAGTAETTRALDLPRDEPFRRDLQMTRADLAFTELKAISPGQASESDEEATYRDPSENVYVTGRVEWVEGTVAKGIRLHMAATYRAPGGMTGPGVDYNTELFDIPDNGTFVELVPAPLLSTSADGAEADLGPSLVYLPGQYRVQVSASSGSFYSDTATTSFVEDPEGIFAALDG